MEGFPGGEIGNLSPRLQEECKMDENAFNVIEERLDHELWLHQAWRENQHDTHVTQLRTT